MGLGKQEKDSLEAGLRTSEGALYIKRSPASRQPFQKFLHLKGAT